MDGSWSVTRVGRLQHHACVPVGGIDGHGGPREFRRGTSQSRAGRVGRRQGRGRLPGGTRPVSPRARSGWTAGRNCFQVPMVSSERRRPRTATARSSSAGSAARPPIRAGDPNFQSAWVWTTRDGTRCLPAPRACVVSPGPPIIVEANATSDDGRVIGGGQNVGRIDGFQRHHLDRPRSRSI